jgi:hypothetical protein
LSLAASAHIEQSGPASPLFFRQQMDELALIEPHHDSQFPAAIAHALGQIPPSTPTLLVSTRPIDWNALASGASGQQAALGGRNLQSVDVSSDELSRYFRS